MLPAVAIVPAHNEERTVGQTVRSLVLSGVFQRVLVVSDGSSDNTALEAKKAGAYVLELQPNRGKGGAMLEALRATTEPVVAFFDADSADLRPEHAQAIVAPVVNGTHGMCLGFNDHGKYASMQWALPAITGQRAVCREILESVPDQFWKGYGIEVAINEAAAASGMPICATVLRGLTPPAKWQKSGVARGLQDSVRMAREVLMAMRDARMFRSGPPTSSFCVEAIIPAFMEEKNIGDVVDTVVSSGLFRRVIVVDDGSSDSTSEVAANAGAEVLMLQSNVGKGGAMRAGFLRTSAPWCAFFDADLKGLKRHHLADLCAEASTERYGMACAIFEPPSRVMQPTEMVGLNLTGQRIVHRSVLERLPSWLWDGFGIECALNEANARCGYLERRIFWSGVRGATQAQRAGGGIAGVRRLMGIYKKALTTAGLARTTSW